VHIITLYDWLPPPYYSTTPIAPAAPSHLSLSIFNAQQHPRTYGTIIVLPAMYLVLCLVIIIPPHTPRVLVVIIAAVVALMASSW